MVSSLQRWSQADGKLYGCALVGWLLHHELVRHIAQALDYDIAFVGGTVRDGMLALMRAAPAYHATVMPWITAPDSPPARVIAPSDLRRDLYQVLARRVDVVTTLPPCEVVRKLRQARIPCDQTAVRFGVITATVRGIGVDITSQRDDSHYDGRYPKVRFGVDRACDAQRRDFTVNALYLNLDGRIDDPLGTAKDDLIQGVLRFIGEPMTRLQQDRVRLFRYFRCAADIAAPTPPSDDIMTALHVVASDPVTKKVLSERRIQRELVAMIGRVGIDWDAVRACGILHLVPSPVPRNCLPLTALAVRAWQAQRDLIHDEAMELYANLGVSQDL